MGDQWLDIVRDASASQGDFDFGRMMAPERNEDGVVDRLCSTGLLILHPAGAAAGAATSAVKSISGVAQSYIDANQRVKGLELYVRDRHNAREQKLGVMGKVIEDRENGRQADLQTLDKQYADMAHCRDHQLQERETELKDEHQRRQDQLDELKEINSQAVKLKKEELDAKRMSLDKLKETFADKKDQRAYELEMKKLDLENRKLDMGIL